MFFSQDAYFHFIPIPIFCGLILFQVSSIFLPFASHYFAANFLYSCYWNFHFSYKIWTVFCKTILVALLPSI